MKTKLLLIAGLLFAGLLFNSCQKDNDLLEEATLKQDTDMLLASGNQDKDSDAPWGFSDVLTNYPDPFRNKTIIEYKVPRPTWITLIVFHRQEQFVLRLVSEFQHEGVYRVEFDASEFPPGQYVAELKIGKKVIREVMTKVRPESSGKIHKDL